jgi:hypothetical protein
MVIILIALNNIGERPQPHTQPLAADLCTAQTADPLHKFDGLGADADDGDDFQ